MTLFESLRMSAAYMIMALLIVVLPKNTIGISYIHALDECFTR